MRFVAGRGAAAKSYREDVAGRGAVAEILLPGRTIGKKMLAGGAVAELQAGSCRKALRHKKESDP